MDYFAPGTVVLHEMPQVDESGLTGAPVITDVKPMVVIEDGPERTALWLPAGTPTMLCLPIPRDRPKPWGPGEWELVESSWSRWNSVFLMRPDEWHAVWVMWSPGWEFQGWYVNLQEPFVRAERGFLVRDLQLDIVVAPDRTWRWKDVDDLERCVELGVISKLIAERVQAEGEALTARIAAGAEPFDDSWVEWRPDTAWRVPALPGSHSGGRTFPWAVSDPAR